MAGEVAGHGSGVDDVAVAVLEEVGEERSVPVDDAPQVHADDPPPVVEVHAPAAHAAGDSGVVAHEVHPTEALEGGVAQPVDGFGVGHVRGHRDDVDAAALHALGRLVEARDLDVRENDVHPFVCEAFGERAPHATRRAGDDSGLSRKILHGASEWGRVFGRSQHLTSRTGDDAVTRLRSEHRVHLRSGGERRVLPSGLEIRSPHACDPASLASLLLAAYRGTVDDEGEDEADARRGDGLLPRASSTTRTQWCCSQMVSRCAWRLS